MADNSELAVDKVMARRNGTYYVLNAPSSHGQGVVTVKHTNRDTFVCNTCGQADVLGREPDGERHTGCLHTRVAVKHHETEGEPDVGTMWVWKTISGRRVKFAEPVATWAAA